MSKSLLLKSSKIFKNSTLIDQIHQSVIDLRTDPPEDEVEILLNESISYLDEEIDLLTSSELFSLILSIFSNFPELSMKKFKKILKKSKSDSNHIIITASIICHMLHEHPRIKFTSDYESFINESYSQILPQISKSEEKPLMIFECKIDKQFKADFILDVFLSTSLTKQKVADIFPFVFSFKSTSYTKLNYFINDVSKKNFLSTIPESVLTKNNVYLNFSCKNLVNLISITSKETLLKILPQIDENFIRVNLVDRWLSLQLILKCIKYDIKFESISNLLNYIKPKDLTEEMWVYFEKYNIQIPEILLEKIQDFPDSPIILNLFSKPEKIPRELLGKLLLKANNLKIYEHALRSYNINCPELSTVEFWNHVISVVSNSENGCSIFLLNRFVFYFMNFIHRQDNFIDLFNDIVLENLDANNKGADFLFNIFNNMNYDDRNKFNGYHNMKQFIPRVVENDKIPHISICKMLAINSFSYLALTPKILYIYSFAYYKPTFMFKKIKIFQQTSKSIEMITKFIQTKDFQLIVNMDHQSLSLISSAFFSACIQNFIDIDGLDEQTILPFFACAFHYVENNKKDSYFKMQMKVFSLLEESVNQLDNNDSQLLNTSIDSILSHLDYFCNPSYINLDTSYKIIDTLFSLLLKGNYKANKYILLSTIFILTSNDDIQFKKQKKYISALVQKFGKEIFNFVIENLHELDQNELNKCLWDLNCFDKNEIKNVIVNNLTKSSRQTVINMILFLSKNCRFLPEIKLTKNENIMEILDELIDEKMWDDFLLVVQFMKNNKLLLNELDKMKDKSIPINIKNQIFNNKINIKNMDSDIISVILTDPNPEKHNNNFEKLFKYMVKDKTIAIEYITALFDCQIKNEDIYFFNINQRKKILLMYNENPDFVIDAVSHSFAVSTNIDTLVRKINVQLPLSEFTDSIISNLLDIGTYQSFICLNKIASFIPFIFSEYFQKVIKVVLPTLDIFLSLTNFEDNENVDRLNDLKKSISAFSFLNSCLYSVKMLDAFVPWLFENLTKLSDSQSYSLMIILVSLFESKNIDMIILSLSIKYNFIEIIQNLLQKNFEEEIFEKNYKELIYILLENYYRLISTINQSSKPNLDDRYTDRFINFLIYPIFLDQYQHINNPFQLAFNNSSILSTTIHPIKKDFIRNETLNQFYSDINDLHAFSINYKDNDNHYHYEEQLLRFETLIARVKEVCIKTTQDRYHLYFYSNNMTIAMYRYIASQPFWIANWIFNSNTFHPTKEHRDQLVKVIDRLKILERKARTSTDIEDKQYDFTYEDFIFNQYCQSKLFKNLVIEASRNGNKKFLCKLLQEITKNGVSLLSFLEFFEQFITNENNKNDLYSSSKSIENIMNVITYMSKNESFENNFIDVCGNKIINIILSPKYRNNPNLLSYISTLFYSINCEIPNKITHLIGFMLYSNQSQIVPQALDLYTKFNDKMKKNLKKIIEYSFEREMLSQQPSYINIRSFFDKVPDLAKRNHTKMYKLIDTCIINYSKKKDLNLLNLITSLFNLLAPKRNNSQALIITDSNGLDFSMTITIDSMRLLSDSGDQNSILKPAPQVLVDYSPKFWSVYDKYRHFINNLILEDIENLEKFKFLVDYYELIVFNVRASYFKDKIKNRINMYDILYINVSRDNLLRDSFNVFNRLQPKDYLKKFMVFFQNEAGVDAGGLTREWFTLIIKNLLNPEYGLFAQTKNHTFQPSPQSYKIDNNIEYFKFAGSIIARSIIEGQCVNAHLSKAFLRQILHRSPKFKDLEDFDDELYQSLQYILDNDMNDIGEMYFEIDVKEFDEYKQVQLIENGENVLVTNENKKEYVTLYACYHLSKCILKQINAFRSGFDSLIPPNLLKMFSPNELDLLICGVPEIDVNDLKANTIYQYPYNADHPVIKMFFDVISDWENDNLAKFLLFLTGSSQVPMNGFKEYADKGVPVKIMRGGDKTKFPVSHTCFNLLALPEYDNEIDMNNKLMTAIQVEDFGII